MLSFLRADFFLQMISEVFFGLNAIVTAMNLKIFMGRNIFSREKKNHYLLKVMICVSFNCNTRAIPQYLTHLFPVPVPLISIRTLPCTTFKKSYPYMLRTRHLISKLFCLGFRTRTPISKPARTLSVHYTHF